MLTGIKSPTELAFQSKVFRFFCKAGLFVFGSGLATVPFLHGDIVQEHHWLTERQFLVALIGFLLAGPLGAFSAAAGVFLPV